MFLLCVTLTIWVDLFPVFANVCVNDGVCVLCVCVCVCFLFFFLCHYCHLCVFVCDCLFVFVFVFSFFLKLVGHVFCIF